MPKVGGRRKKLRSHKEPDAQQERLTPKTFVFKKGKCPEEMQDLTLDLRKCFYPHTAMKLQDSNKISVKSYLKAAKYYNVNYLVTLQHSKDRQYIRFIKVGGGQMTFRIMNFSRMKDVLKEGGQPFSYSFKESLLVLNGFGENQQVKMIGKGLQEIFPSLNLAKAKTQNLKRVMSFSYRPKKKYIFFRQYKIIQTEGGVSSTFQRLMQKPKDLSNFRSLKQYLQSQESNIQGSENQQKLNLVEIGPRMKLKFISYKQSAGVLSEKQLQQAQNQYKDQGKKKDRSERKNKKQRRDQTQDDEQDEQMDEQDQNDQGQQGQEQINEQENDQFLQDEEIQLEQEENQQ